MKISNIDNIIDSSWHYSWYWENENGYLTARGLQQAKSDGLLLLADLQERCRKIKYALSRIETEIGKYGNE